MHCFVLRGVRVYLKNLVVVIAKCLEVKIKIGGKK